MKVSTFIVSCAVAGFPAFVNAASSASSPVGSPASSPSSGTVTGPSVSLLSTNPTAVPLSNINGNAATATTLPLSSTPAPGSTPTFIPNAPGLPNPGSIVISSYPPLDKAPPIDSPEVKQWIQDVKNSGVQIPNIGTTVAGGCPANAQAAADTSRCWWTCGGCTRDTDVVACPEKMTWGLTYDDGPSYYTPNLLQYLNEQDLKSTFFVVGSRALSFPALLQSQYMAEHQIAVHTWSHPSLTTLTNEAIIAELGWTKKIIKDVLGVTPNMMRPPYGDIDDRVRAISLAMGLTPVMWTRISPLATFDTDDFNIHSGTTTVQQVLQNWEYILGNASSINTGFIVLEHDLFQQTVEVATGYILPDALAHNPKFTIEPVISCLNKPMRDAYIETNDNSTNPQPINSASVPATALSSGAPGSVQATGGASNGGGNTGDAVSIHTDSVLGVALGMIAGFASIL